MAKILLLIADIGFQPKEYGDTRTALLRAGHSVVTACARGGVATSSTNEEMPTDLKLSEVKVADYDGIFVIGGPGCLIHLDNDETVRIMREIQERGNAVYGAICVAPRILARAGLLRGIRVTGWNNDGKLGPICDNGGCILESRAVVHDGRAITANGPAAAKDFGEAIVAALPAQIHGD